MAAPLPVANWQNNYSGGVGAVATTAGTATTYTGLVLSNPNNSQVNLVPKGVVVASIVAQAAAIQFGLMTGYSTTDVTHTSAVTPVSSWVGGGASQGLAYAGNTSGGAGKLDSSATLPATPKLAMPLGTLLTGAITTTPIEMGFIPLLDNGGYPLFVIPPGAFMAVWTSAASTASSLVLSFIWSEQ